MEITIKKYYSCAICGRSFTEKAKVDKCEWSHVKIAVDPKIEMQFVRGYSQPYPETIRVLMEDGAIATYNLITAKKVQP